MGQFPDCQKLFCDILNVPRRLTLEMLVQEAKYQTRRNLTFPADHMKPVLFELACHVEKCNDEQEWEHKMQSWMPLDGMAIFPVKYPNEAEARLVSRHEEFFVPDHSDYWHCFKGLVPTLDVSIKEAEALYPLLNGFAGRIKGISQAVVNDWTTNGKERLDVDWTMRMRSKVPQLLR